MPVTKLGGFLRISTTPWVCFDENIVTRTVINLKTRYFFNLRQSGETGEKYLSLTQVSNGRKSEMRIGLKHVNFFTSSLKSAQEGEVIEELQLGKEKYSFELNLDFDPAVKVTQTIWKPWKPGDAGRRERDKRLGIKIKSYKKIYFIEEEVGRVLTTLNEIEDLSAVEKPSDES